MKDSESYRVADLGGNGCRIVDLRNDIKPNDLNIRVMTADLITGPDALVNFILSNLPSDNTRIGVSAAGDITEDGTMNTSPNNPRLIGFRLSTEIRKRSRKPTYVANDMEAGVAGMAEQHPDCSNIMGITWSSGLGVGFKFGFNFGSLIVKSEGSHMHRDNLDSGTLCGHGGRGCFESEIGGERIKDRVITELRTRGLPLPEGTHPCTYLDECFAREEKWAMEIYGLVCDAMGHWLANIQALLDMRTAVWKGSFALKGMRNNPKIETLIRRAMRKYLFDKKREERLEFRYVKIPPEVPIDYESFLGAAALVEKHGC